jgi:hypothetical protein
VGVSFGLDSRNRVASFKFSINVGSPNTISESQLAQLSLDKAKLIRRVNPATGIVSYSANFDLSFEVLMNAASPKYIDVPYDPYPAYKWGTQNQYVTEWHNFDLRASLGEEQYNALWAAFSQVPRKVFERNSFKNKL